MAFDVSKHYLVPKHSKASDSEKQEVLKKYGISGWGLPKITLRDPAIAKLNAKEGDVIKIERVSPTAGIAVYYRIVIAG